MYTHTRTHRKLYTAKLLINASGVYLYLLQMPKYWYPSVREINVYMTFYNGTRRLFGIGVYWDRAFIKVLRYNGSALWTSLPYRGTCMTLGDIIGREGV